MGGPALGEGLRRGVHRRDLRRVRDGQVANRPFYAVIRVDLAGHKDVLGLWAGTGIARARKFWLHVLAELKNRGVEEVFSIVCDGLKGLPDSVGAVFPQAAVRFITHDAFEGRSTKLTALNVAHELVTVVIMAVLIGIWPPALG